MNNREIYEYLAENSKQGHRPVDILKSVNHELYMELCGKYGSQSYRHNSGPRLNSEILFNFLLPDSERLCRECGKETSFKDFKIGYAPYCGFSCANVKDGVRRAACVSTLQRNYGVSVPAHNIDVLDRMKSTMLNRYGVDNAQKNVAIRERSKATIIERYGVENAMQVPEILAKHSRKRYRRKNVTIGGIEFSLQGYEPQAVKYLIERYGVDPAILKGRVPSIHYSHDGKHRRYIPDFVVDDLLIEVKSPYTAGMEGSVALRDQMEAKLSGARDAGYNTLLMVMNKDGSLHAASYNGGALSSTLSGVDSEKVRKMLS
jgi:hypothetical protein